MSIRLSEIRITLAFIMFLILVALQPLWSYGQHGLELLPSLNFSAILMVALLFYTPLSLLAQPRINFILGLFLFYFLSLLVWASIQFPALFKASPLDAVLMYAASIIYPTAAVVFSLEYNVFRDKLARSANWRNILFFFFILYVCVVGLSALYRLFLLEGFSFPFIYSKPGAALTYLGVSSGFAILGLMVVSLQKSCTRSIKFLLLIIMILPVLLSRFTVFAFVMIWVALCVSVYKKRLPALLLGGMAACFVAAAFLLLVPLEYLQEWRITKVLINPFADSSFTARIHLHEQAMIAIKESPFMGEYGQEIRSGTGRGTYAHNVLSFWQQYGFVFFALKIAFLIIVLFAALRKLARGISLPMEFFPVGMVLFGVLGSFIAKSYVWPFSYMAIGIGLTFFFTGKDFWLREDVHKRCTVANPEAEMEF